VLLRDSPIARSRKKKGSYHQTRRKASEPQGARKDEVDEIT
jgi:hypothetical protein